MERKAIKLNLENITENNLKGLNFEEETGRILLVSGVSGSGKSTLVHRVIAEEANRQKLMRQKSDDIYVYAVRPKFSSASILPEVIEISQRPIFLTNASSFGTITGLNKLLVKIFVDHGEIFYKGKKITKPTFVEIKQFQERYYPESKLYALLSHYQEVDKSTLVALMKVNNVNDVCIRNEKTEKIRRVSISNLPSTNLSNYEILVDLENLNDDNIIRSLSRSGILLVDRELELNFDEHYFSLENGTIFRKPSVLLFSKSTRSSLSGACANCNGDGYMMVFKTLEVINDNVPICKGLLNVPLTKSGRYQGFGFLPSGLTNLIKKQGVDVESSYSKLSKEHKQAILDILNEKLVSNKADVNAQVFISQVECRSCDGSGLSWQARAVTFNDKPVDYYLCLSPNQLLKEMQGVILNNQSVQKIRKVLDVIDKLSIGHITLDRRVTEMSSGELQQSKLLEALVSQEANKIIILDEPSSNLQYKDNLKLIQFILQMKARNNSVIIVDHNPIYHLIADRVIKIGPKAGDEGGYYCEPDDITQSNVNFEVFENLNASDRASIRFKKLKLIAKRNVQLHQISLPKQTLSAFIGESGAGKTTLALDMITNALKDENDDVIVLDSKSPKGSSTSIVATYLNVFDKVRKVYAQSTANSLTESDFSFNSQGACEQCNGTGYVEGNSCGICFGSRYKAEVALISHEGKTIIELLNTDLKKIQLDGAFYFLKEFIQVMDLLSLSHIALGREISSLSGGELQRLKLAQFILKHFGSKSKKDSYVILDEPCRGLDRLAIEKLYKAITYYLEGCTIIVIEHNPYLIYKCQYIFNLGKSDGEKNEKTIIHGFLNDVHFPSLNHNDIIKKVVTVKAELKQDFSIEHVVFEENVALRVLPSKRFNLIDNFFIQQKNHAVESQFSQGFKLFINDQNVFFHKEKSDLLKSIENIDVYYFNPFMPFLCKYSKVPTSIYSSVLSKFSKREIIDKEEVWKIKVKASSVEDAYVNGGGVVITDSFDMGSLRYNYHSVRLISLEARVVDNIFPESFAFNLYRNACVYCNGYGHIKSYPFEKWLNSSYSILDEQSCLYKINKVLPKATIKRFVDEGLVDFRQEIKILTQEEYYYLLYGFKAYKFLKSGKINNTEDCYHEWRGINSYLYHSASKLSPKKDIHQYLSWIVCPFCKKGFSPKTAYYHFNGHSIIDYISNSNLF